MFCCNIHSNRFRPFYFVSLSNFSLPVINSLYYVYLLVNFIVTLIITLYYKSNIVIAIRDIQIIYIIIMLAF